MSTTGTQWPAELSRGRHALATGLPRLAIVPGDLQGRVRKEGAMSQANDPNPDEDLTPRFRWRWAEHGIYLAVCSIIGLCVLVLYMWRLPAHRRFRPDLVQLIHVRYLTAADEPADRNEPFRDTRLIRAPGKQVLERPIRRSM